MIYGIEPGSTTVAIVAVGLAHRLGWVVRAAELVDVTPMRAPFWDGPSFVRDALRSDPMPPWARWFDRFRFIEPESGRSRCLPSPCLVPMWSVVRIKQPTSLAVRRRNKRRRFVQSLAA